MTCFTGLPVGVEDSKREVGVIVIDQYFNAPFIPKSCVQGHKSKAKKKGPRYTAKANANKQYLITDWNEEWTRRAFPLVLRW